VFVTSDGHVKILDFGLAKLTQVESVLPGISQLPTTPPDTQPGMLLGTMGYMAPEQVRGQPVDHRADLFAFGAILYEMLSGQRAFAGATAADTLSAILDKEPQDLPVAERRIPAGLARVVDRCLEKNPASRFQSTRDLTFALEALDISSSTSDARIPRPTRASRGGFAWFLGTAALVAASVATTMYFRPTVSQPVVTRLELNTPPTSDPFSFALSPDGRQVAFVAASETGPRLWVRPLDQVSARPLGGTEGATYPFWSPDGRSVGFFADAKLKRVDLTGGAPQTLADAPTARGATWNRDGVIVFASTAGQGLTQVPAGGGPPTTVMRPRPGETNLRWPQFLPDGRRFLVQVLESSGARGVYIGSLDGGEPKRVLDAETAGIYAAGYLLSVSQGVLVARRFDPALGSVSGDPMTVAQSVGVESALGRAGVSVSDTGVLAHRNGAAGRRQFVWVDRAGKTLGVLVPPEETALASPELAANGERLALYRTMQGNTDVWLVEVARGLANRFTFAPAIDAAPVWSPDGNRIIFRSARGGHYDLFEKPANGAADEQPLLVTPQDKSPLDWSPDGRVLLYASQDPKNQSDLWALPLTGERKPFPIVQTSFDEVHGQFSPDGRWLAYASNESGRYEVYARSFPDAGGKFQLSTGGGIYPRWRRDGRELYYITPDNRMMAVPIELAPATRTLNPGSPVALFASRLATQGSAGLAGFGSKAQYAVARDGRFLLNVAAEDTTSPITIVLNWSAALGK
jgi:Tol biopolymer transport system component